MQSSIKDSLVRPFDHQTLDIAASGIELPSGLCANDRCPDVCYYKWATRKCVWARVCMQESNNNKFILYPNKKVYVAAQYLVPPFKDTLSHSGSYSAGNTALWDQKICCTIVWQCFICWHMIVYLCFVFSFVWKNKPLSQPIMYISILFVLSGGWTNT